MYGFLIFFSILKTYHASYTALINERQQKHCQSKFTPYLLTKFSKKMWEKMEQIDCFKKKLIKEKEECPITSDELLPKLYKDYLFYMYGCTERVFTCANKPSSMLFTANFENYQPFVSNLYETYPNLDKRDAHLSNINKVTLNPILDCNITYSDFESFPRLIFNGSNNIVGFIMSEKNKNSREHSPDANTTTNPISDNKSYISEIKSTDVFNESKVPVLLKPKKELTINNSENKYIEKTLSDYDSKKGNLTASNYAGSSKEYNHSIHNYNYSIAADSKDIPSGPYKGNIPNNNMHPEDQTTASWFKNLNTISYFALFFTVVSIVLFILLIYNLVKIYQNRRRNKRKPNPLLNYEL